MSDQSPPLSTAPPLPPAPPLRLAPPPPPVKKPRVFKVAHDITEPDVPVVEPVVVEPVVVEPVVPAVTVVEPVSVVEPVVVEPVVPAVPAPVVEPVVEPVAEPVVVPAPVDFDREVEMWRGIELPPVVAKIEEDDDMPPLIPVNQLSSMPPLEDCEDDIEDDMPALEDGHNDVTDTLPLGDSDDDQDENHADDEGEHPQVDEEEQEEPKLQIDEDCQFLHDESDTIDGELESFSKRIYTALTDINNLLFTAFVTAALGFILVNTLDNRVLNNLNEL